MKQLYPTETAFYPTMLRKACELDEGQFESTFLFLEAACRAMYMQNLISCKTLSRVKYMTLCSATK